MSDSPEAAAGLRAHAFRHEAFVYRDDDDVAHLGAFVEAGLARDEAVLAVLDADKIDTLRSALGRDAGRVQFADMAAVGRNPARIIETWQRFLDRTDPTGRGRRGIGEPVWRGRSVAELAECHHHEALLNVAFADAVSFHLLCPYDASSLPPAVVERAAGTHPYVYDPSGHVQESRYQALDAPHPVDALPEPPDSAVRFSFDLPGLAALRSFVDERVRQLGLSSRRAAELVAAVSEVATNSVLHGGGRGTAIVWDADGAALVEIRDAGRIGDPLVGRFRPASGQAGGYGVWLANQLCDLVQIRSGEGGTTIRLHVGR